MKVEKEGKITFTITGKKAENPAVLAFINAIISEDELHLRALETIYNQMPKIVSLIEQSANELSEKFQVLATASQEQADNIHKFSDLTKSLDYEGKTITLQEAFELINKSNAQSVETILYTSKMSVSAAFNLHRVMEKINQINMQLPDIEKKPKETKDLITQTLSEIISLINDCHDTLGKIATIDMRSNIIAKESLDMLMHTILKQNYILSKVMEEAVDEAHKASRNIRAMTINMQFQDKASQWISYSLDVLKLMFDNIKSRQANIDKGEPIAINPSQAIEIANAFKLGDLQNYFADRLIANRNLESRNIFTSFSGQQDDDMSDNQDDIRLF